MIDLVFGDSALGSLKVAQHYGEGEYQCSFGVIVTSFDGGKAGEKEIEQARLEFERKDRSSWEKAVPMGGDPADIYGFGLELSIGDISENVPGVERLKALEWLYSIYPNDEGEEAAGTLQGSVKSTLDEIFSRMDRGEDLRIWHSSNPDEACGLHWFMDRLYQMGRPYGQIYLVELPRWEVDESGDITQKNSWGEVGPSEWAQYLPLQKAAPQSFIQECARCWQSLQKENAPLRAVLNGRLVSVSEAIYDDFIISEIEKEAKIFDEVMIIGRVLGNYQLGIGDAWVAHRIEKMIQEGKLISVTQADKDMPIYHRKLKKAN